MQIVLDLVPEAGARKRTSKQASKPLVPAHHVRTLTQAPLQLKALKFAPNTQSHKPEKVPGSVWKEA